MFFWYGCRPELAPPELLPLRLGGLDELEEAEAASTTWLVVTTLLKVLLPLTEMIVVTTAWVLLLCGAVVVVDSAVDGAPEVADCELKANEDCVSELNMKDVDCAWSNEALLLVAPNDDAVVCADADEGFDAAADCEALAEGEGDADADAVADAEAPVLKGTAFCRYRRRPSISRPAERLAKSMGRKNAPSPKRCMILERVRGSTIKHRTPKTV